MESELIIDTLKQTLRSKKITYRDVADKLSISEVSVKRIFSERKCTLQRTEEICQILEISFFDLLSWVDKYHEDTFSFTKKQEQYFVANYELFEFWNYLYKDRPKISDAAKRFQLSPQQLRKNLKTLEEFELILVQPKDKFKFKVKGTLNLIEDGPLQRKTTRALAVRFLDRLHPSHSADREHFTMSHRRVSEATLNDICHKLHQTFQEFRDRSYRDEKLLGREKLVDVQWLGGITIIEKNEPRTLSV